MKTNDAVFKYDPINERFVVGSAIASSEILKRLLSTVYPDHFQEKQHRLIWEALREIGHRKLVPSPHAIVQMVEGIDFEYLTTLIEEHPKEVPNINFHLDRLKWDRTRIQGLTGPIDALVRELNNPQAEFDRVRSLARQVSSHFDRTADTKFLLDPIELSEMATRERQKRREGIAVFKYGVPGLDDYEPEPSGYVRPRLLPGAAPGKMTVIVGVPGSGKSTFTASMILGIARSKRKVLVGAWELEPFYNLELLAGMSLGLKREDVLIGNVTDEQHTAMHARQLAISKYVQFFENPFNRVRKARSNNEQNLDLIQSYLESSGCEVFVADLWRRCLTTIEPNDEERALIRQQAMLQELRIHGILVQQLNIKDTERTSNQRPSRDLIKGSGSWIEVADTILGVHRPSQSKPTLPENELEVFVLKQRYGRWPLGIQFSYDSETGVVSGGKSMSQDELAGNNELDQAVGAVNFKTKRRK